MYRCLCCSPCWQWAQTCKEVIKIYPQQQGEQNVWSNPTGCWSHCITQESHEKTKKESGDTQKNLPALKKDIEVLIVAPACTPLSALNIIEVTGKAFTLMFAALKCLATQSPGCHSHKSKAYLNKFIWEKYQNDTADTHGL